MKETEEEGADVKREEECDSLEGSETSAIQPDKLAETS